MGSKFCRRLAKNASFALCLLALSAVPTSAQARSWLLFGPQLGQSTLFLLGSGSLCIGFTYDPNGNRTAQTVATIGSGATLWGSGTFGCFLWDQ